MANKDLNADKRGRNCPFQYSMIKIAKTLKIRRRQGLLFETYLQAKGIQCPTIAQELATVLRKLYPKVRTKSGKLYAKSSLCAIRFGLCRHFKQVLKVDIIKHKEFNEANRIYEAQCVELKKQGSAKI